MFQDFFDILNVLDFDFFTGLNFASDFSFLFSLLACSIICFLPVAIIIKLIRGITNA